MDIKLPTTEEIHAAYAQSEDAVQALFKQIEEQAKHCLPSPVISQQVRFLERLHQKLEKQTKRNKHLSLELLNQKHTFNQAAIISTTNRKGIITFANANFCQITEYPQHNLIGQNYNIIKSDVHPPEFYKKLWHTILAGNVWRGEVCNTSQHGTLFWINSAIVPIFDDENRIKEFYNISFEITKQKLMETELTQSLAMANQANQAKTDFLANMSHEIRTPLNSIAGFSQLVMLQAEELNLPAETINHLTQIINSSDHVTEIISDILDMSKIESGKLEIISSRVNLKTLVRKIYLSNKPKADQKQIAFNYMIDTDVSADIIIDETRFNQILINLINNAIKFTPKHKAIDVFIKTINNQLICEVIDQGIGIHKDKHQIIFNRFEQADTGTMRRYGGSGVGLSLVKQLVEKMQGQVSVISAEGQGSCFKVRFPLVIAPPEDEKIAKTLIKGNCFNFQYTILVVEDDLINQKVVQHLLKQLKVNVLLANDGLCGLGTVLKKQPDLILMDMSMPILGGFEASRIIKATPIIADIPIVVLSADALAEQQQAAYRIGIKDYITKPLKLDKLTEILNRYLC
jgi:PAS domain S-box-containing protein